MHKIVAKEQLSDLVFRIRVEAPLIAEEREAGQFVILQLDTDFGERIPLTIANADPAEGTITLIFQAVGKTTETLATYEVGDQVAAILGPLGSATEVTNYGHVVCVAGGIGAAPLYPIVQAMKEAGNKLTLILGARNKELMILESEMAELVDELIVVTDDGSHGRKALVTEPLKELCEAPEPPNLVVAIGPPIMMKFAAATTKPYGVPTVVSLNSIMVDGTGMCGGCRVTVGGKTKFTCVDGPEFDGHEVDFENLLNRLGAYKPQEQHAREACQLNKIG